MLLRSLDELHDFLELLLCFVHAGSVGESHFGISFHVDLGLTLADGHQTTHAHPALLAHAPHDIHPDYDEDDGWDDPGKESAEKSIFNFAFEFDSVFGKRVGEAGINANSREMRLLVLCRLLKRAGDGIAADRNVLDGT